MALLIGALGLVSCGSAHLRRVAGDWYVDDVAPGAPSPRLYWVKDGRRIVVDRQIRSIVHPGCIVYETARPSVAAVVFAVETGKRPVAVATSDGLHPWHLAPEGLRRFDAPATDADGVTRLGMEFIESGEACMLAWKQPPFEEAWGAQAGLDTGAVKIARTLFDVHGADSVGNSTLSEAVGKRHLAIVDELIRAGADTNTANAAGITPLMTAVAFDAESTAILERLLTAGADVNAQDTGGMTALMHAAHYGRKEAVSVLLARGADASIHDNMGRTAAAMTSDSHDAMNRQLENAARRK